MVVAFRIVTHSAPTRFARLAGNFTHHRSENGLEMCARLNASFADSCTPTVENYAALDPPDPELVTVKCSACCRSSVTRHDLWIFTHDGIGLAEVSLTLERYW